MLSDEGTTILFGFLIIHPSMLAIRLPYAAAAFWRMIVSTDEVSLMAASAVSFVALRRRRNIPRTPTRATPATPPTTDAAMVAFETLLPQEGVCVRTSLGK